MKRYERSSSLLTIMLITALLGGCLGGGSRPAATFKLTFIVLNDATKMPVEGAVVTVIGESMATKEADSQGRVSFSGLKGTIELIVCATGFANKTQTVAMDKERSLTVHLTTDETAAVIHSTDDLNKALANNGVSSIHLADDLLLTETLAIDRPPVNLNLNGKKLTGDVSFTFDDAGTFELSGSGRIEGGDLTVNAPNASVTNYLHVDGIVVIQSVADKTWHEHHFANHLLLEGSGIHLNVFNGAEKIEISQGVLETTISIQAGTVVEFIANSGVSVTGGADRIARAIVNAPGVTFDLSPQDLGGYEHPVITQPFVPGSGGTIAEFTPPSPPPDGRFWRSLCGTHPTRI